MEPQQDEAESVIAPLKKVTPLSKYLAMSLFIILPFLGGWIGYNLAPEKVVEVEKVVFKEVFVEREIESSGVVIMDSVVDTKVFEDGELNISFLYPSSWNIEKGETCGYRLLTGLQGAFLSAFSWSEVQTCSDAVGPTWHIMASGVSDNYISKCEVNSDCTVLVSDYGVRITKEEGYIHPSSGKGVCSENGETLYGMDEMTGFECGLNATYQIYRDGGDFSGFVLNTAGLQPEIYDRSAIIQDFENVVVKGFRFIE